MFATGLGVHDQGISDQWALGMCNKQALLTLQRPELPLFAAGQFQSFQVRSKVKANTDTDTLLGTFCSSSCPASIAPMFFCRVLQVPRSSCSSTTTRHADPGGSSMATGRVGFPVVGVRLLASLRLAGRYAQVRFSVDNKFRRVVAPGCFYF